MPLSDDDGEYYSRGGAHGHSDVEYGNKSPKPSALNNNKTNKNLKTNTNNINNESY